MKALKHQKKLAGEHLNMARWNLVDWWRVTSDLMRLYHVLPITMFQLLVMFHSVPPPKLHNNSCHWVGYSKTLLRKVGSSICLQRLNVVINHQTQPQPPGPNGLNPQTGSRAHWLDRTTRGPEATIKRWSFEVRWVQELQHYMNYVSWTQPNPKTCQKWSQRISQPRMFAKCLAPDAQGSHHITWLSTSLSHLRIDKVGIIWKKTSASEISKRRNFQGLQSIKSLPRG